MFILLGNQYGDPNDPSISGVSGWMQDPNPTQGLIRITWNLSGDLTLCWLYLEASYDGMDTWTNIWDGDPNIETNVDLNLLVYPGFSNLDFTYFRLHLVIGGIEQINSPMIAFPPYPEL